MDRGISMPTASRAACTYSESFSMPFSVTSVATKGCGSALRSHAVMLRGPGHRAGNLLHQVDAHVHLQPGEAHLFLARLQALREDVRVLRFVGVGVDSDAVAKLAAQHLVDGHVVHLAGDVPEGLFDGHHAARLPPMKSELFDLLKKIGDVERVLVQQAALQKQRVSGAGAVAHFTQSVDALVGVDADDRARTRPGLHHYGHAQVGDLERGRARMVLTFR